EDSVPWTKSALCLKCNRLAESLGFEFTAYALRHTFCTDRLIAGVDPLTVAKLMGNSPEMVMRVYNSLGKCQNHRFLSVVAWCSDAPILLGKLVLYQLSYTRAVFA